MEDFSWLFFMILALASFRLTHLIVYDDITDPLRQYFIEVKVEQEGTEEQRVSAEARGTGIRRWIGLILMCHWCTGIWSTLLLTLTFLFIPGGLWLLIILAAAGVAAIIETIVLRL